MCWNVEERYSDSLSTLGVRVRVALCTLWRVGVALAVGGGRRPAAAPPPERGGLEPRVRFYFLRV